MLGDGSIEKRLNRLNARYAEGGKNELYLKWKHDFLSQYFQCSFKGRISSPHTKSGKCYPGWWLRTTVHPLLTEWHSQWYRERKIVPRNIVEQYLTEFALAVWFCDDGCSTNGATLYSMGFCEEEVIFLSELLQSRFGLANSILKNKQGQPFIRFRAAASRKIKEILASFALPGMSYKSQNTVTIPQERDNQNTQLANKVFLQGLSDMIDVQQISLFPQRTVAELVEEIENLTKEIQQLYCQDEIPWILGVSFGKDSTAVLQLVWSAIAALPLEKRTKTIYVISTDTFVENPVVSAWVSQSIKLIKIAAKEQKMPIEAHLLHPDIKDTFWVCLIGKGYPAPRNQFRWCTERLKIHPANQFIRDIVRLNGETILLLGTRKAESVTRAATMNKHQAKRVRDRLSPNASLPNSLIYTPIENWRNDEVWIYLNQWQNPWGSDNKNLFSMYRGATADNECPLVIDTSTPSCGDSRLGCWVCTMVSKDKSMQAMIQNDEEKEWMQPLLDIRNELDEEDDRERRDFRRIYGRVELFGKDKVEPIPGPYTKFWREHWLTKVLQAQTQIRKTAPPEMGDITLITQEELSEIRRIWLEEKHEFDDSLPRIYEETTGQPFKDPRPGAERSLLGTDEWTVLEEICEDPMHLELMAKLLDTERQYYTKTRRTGIYDTLEKYFDTSSRDKIEAIDNAHYQRDIKNVVESLKQNPEDIHQFKKVLSGEKPEKDQENPNQQTIEDDKSPKQLSWADLKFAPNDTEDEED